MSKFDYRLFHEDRLVKPEIMEKIEEVTVEQASNIAWEARIFFTIFVDDQGYWTTEINDFLKSFSRIRVEIQSETASFSPLIDGPVVGYDVNMSSEPGESSVAVTIQDDSIFLNQNDEIAKFEQLSDHEIAQQVFSRYKQIYQTEIEEVPPPPGQPPPEVVQRGTAMHLLKFLAKRQGMSAYVLPGADPGQSIAYFRSLPTKPEELKPLVLLGPDRNIESFSVKTNGQMPSNVEATSLIISQKQLLSSTSNLQDIELLGDEPGVENEEDMPTRLLPPHQGESVDLDQAVLAEAKRLGYAIEATGSVLSDRYPSILRPYSVVSVHGANPNVSGDFLITRVTHTITPSNYTQRFVLLRNARTSSSDTTGGKIF